MEIKRDDLSGVEIQALLAEHLTDMHRISPRESVHALDLDGLRQPDITFWTVWSGAELLGCGALKELDARHGEIKSMRTANAHRRTGVGKAMLIHILDEAKRRGYDRLSLETGSMKEFEPARRLYASFGFAPCGPFADYWNDPNSVFMTKRIADSGEMSEGASSPSPLDQYEVSSDPTRLDLDTIHGYLSQSYWSPGVPRFVVQRAIEHSICFGVYRQQDQVGFARVVTDRATFAYLADVFILEAHRGLGLSKKLMASVLAHPDLQGLRRFMLGTRDAHGLYRRFGFANLKNPSRMMEILAPNPYREKES